MKLFLEASQGKILMQQEQVSHKLIICGSAPIYYHTPPQEDGGE